MERLSFFTRILIWCIKHRPDINNTYLQSQDDYELQINYFPETGPGYPGQGTAEDTQLKREWLEHCWERTGPPKRP